MVYKKGNQNIDYLAKANEVADRSEDTEIFRVTMQSLAEMFGEKVVTKTITSARVEYNAYMRWIKMPEASLGTPELTEQEVRLGKSIEVKQAQQKLMLLAPKDTRKKLYLDATFKAALFGAIDTIVENSGNKYRENDESAEYLAFVFYKVLEEDNTIALAAKIAKTITAYVACNTRADGETQHEVAKKVNEMISDQMNAQVPHIEPAPAPTPVQEQQPHAQAQKPVHDEPKVVELSLDNLTMDNIMMFFYKGSDVIVKNMAYEQYRNVVLGKMFSLKKYFKRPDLFNRADVENRTMANDMPLSVFWATFRLMKALPSYAGLYQMYEDHDFMITRIRLLVSALIGRGFTFDRNQDEAVAMEIPLLTFITYHLEMEVEEIEFTKTAQSTLLIMMLVSILRAYNTKPFAEDDYIVIGKQIKAINEEIEKTKETKAEPAAQNQATTTTTPSVPKEENNMTNVIINPASSTESNSGAASDSFETRLAAMRQQLEASAEATNKKNAETFEVHTKAIAENKAAITAVEVRLKKLEDEKNQATVDRIKGTSGDGPTVIYSGGGGKREQSMGEEIFYGGVGVAAVGYLALSAYKVIFGSSE